MIFPTPIKNAEMSAIPPPLPPSGSNQPSPDQSNRSETVSTDPIQQLIGANPSFSKRVVVTILGVSIGTGLALIASEAIGIDLKNPNNKKICALIGCGIAVWTWQRMKGKDDSGGSNENRN